MKNNRFLPQLALLIAAVIWGTSFVVMKIPWISSRQHAACHPLWFGRAYFGCPIRQKSCAESTKNILSKVLSLAFSCIWDISSKPTD